MSPLIDAGALLERIGDERLLLLDARAGADAAPRYEAEHLRGARRVDLETDLSGDTSQPERGGRHPLPGLPTFARSLARLGVAPGVSVVAYDDRSGQLAAARLWWMLRAAGHAEVRVLDGGLEAARAAGVPLESGPGPEDAALDPYPVGDEWALPTVGAERVEELRTALDWRLFDVRAAERYRGEVEPIDPLAGHIAGARSAPLTDCLDAAGRFVDADALRGHLEGVLEGAPPDRAILSCGSGVTACHTLLALDAAGLSGAHLYVGSWSEWCRSDRERLP